MLDFRSGGWVLLLAGLLSVAVVVWRVSVWSKGGRAVGDGRNVETYGFDLSTCLIPRDQIIAVGLPKDGLPALTNPSTIPAATVHARMKLAGVRKLVPSDRVIGLEINGVGRAYPLWVLIWHEVVNDTLGSQPIAVTYSPICDSAVVFDRRVGDELLEFGVSGLLYNSNLLMYDRRPGGTGESLWSQLQFRAVAGPAAEQGRALRILPAGIVTWSAWRARYPDTSVVLPDPRRARVYKNDPYRGYFATDTLHFPVEPLPPEGSYDLKTRIVALRTDDHWEVVPAGTFGDPTDLQGRTAVHAFWFAWYAMHPESTSGHQ